LARKAPLKLDDLSWYIRLLSEIQDFLSSPPREINNKQFRNFEAVHDRLDGTAFYDKNVGGIIDAYVFYNDLREKGPRQAHHRRPGESFIYPLSDKGYYVKILRSIASHPIRGNGGKKLIDIANAYSKGSPSKFEFNPFYTSISKSDCSKCGKQPDHKNTRIDNEPITLENEGMEFLDKIINPGQEPGNMPRNLRIKAREIIDEYIIQLRLKINDIKKERHVEVQSGSIIDYPFIRQINWKYKHRSKFEKECTLFMAQEGELFLGIFLQRLADMYWIPNKDNSGYVPNKGKWHTSNSESWKLVENILNGKKWKESYSSVLGPIAEGGIGFIGLDNKLTVSARRMMEWLVKILDENNSEKYGSLKTALFTSKKPLLNTKYSMENPYGFDLNKDDLAEILAIASKRNPKEEEIIKLFKMLSLKNEYDKHRRLQPYDDVQLSDILHFDPFVIQIYLAAYEDTINENPSKSRRLFFVCPIDPVVVNSADTGNEIFALWAGYLELKDPNSLPDESKMNRIRQMKILLNILGQPIVRDLIEESLGDQIHMARESALKAATAAIMARNMSHNIGSHVLARLSRVADLADNQNGDPARISQLNEYLRTRADFIADISTGSRLVGFPLYIYKEIVEVFIGETPKTGQYLLLNNICKSNNIKKGDIKIELFCNGEHISDENNPNIDMAVQVPNGRTGVHAFYSILENILRNSAKHGLRGKQLKLKINVLGKKRLGEYYSISIWDTCNSCGEITVENTKTNLEDDINWKICEPIIDSNNNLNRECWGLKEMKISAAYLRGFNPEQVDEKGVTPPILTATKVDDSGNKCTSPKGNLCYTFYMQKPRNLAIIDSLHNYKDVENLSLKGISVYNSIEENLNKILSATFTIIYVRDKKELEYINDNLRLLPVRMLLVIDKARIKKPQLTHRIVHRNVVLIEETIYKEISKKIIEQHIEDVLLYLWKIWFGGLNYQLENFSIWMYGDTGTDWKKAQKLADYKIYGPNDINQLISSKTNIIIERHGEMIGRLLKADNASFDNNDLIRTHNLILSKKGIKYVEPYNQPDDIYCIMANPPSEIKSKLLVLNELIESALIHVAIIDERIQERNDETFTRDGYKYQKIKILEDMNISVLPKNKIDLNNIKIAEQGKTQRNILEWLKYLDESKHVDWLVIHQGILDVIGMRNKKTAEEWFNELYKIVPFIIVDSGRGKPHNIASNVRFTALSNLLRYVSESKSKFHLTRLLYLSGRAK
jgi:hypothetical protein